MFLSKQSFLLNTIAAMASGHNNEIVSITAMIRNIYPIPTRLEFDNIKLKTFFNCYGLNKARMITIINQQFYNK